MRIIKLNEIKGGEVLGVDIFDDQERVLLNKGITIKTSYIDRLIEHEIQELYIEDELSEGIVPDEVLLMHARQNAQTLIKQEAKRLMAKKEISIAHINKVIDLIVNDILYNNKKNFLVVKDMRIKDDNIFAHSINVSVMAALLCKKMGFNNQKLKSTVTGCLFHDIGKIFLPQEIIDKSLDKLTTKELELYKSHPRDGYEMFLDNIDISPTTRVTILRHHEYVDGTGFPEGLKGNEINDSAKICALCNCFDQIVNGKERGDLLNTSEAVEYITSYAGMYFDENLVKELINYIPIYPVGSTVLLSNGCLAMVVKNEQGSLIRPVVRVFYDYYNKTKLPYEELDLMKNLSLSIKRELKGNVNNFL